MDDGYIDGGMEPRKDGQTDRRMNGERVEAKARWMDGWMEGVRDGGTN